MVVYSLMLFIYSQVVINTGPYWYTQLRFLLDRFKGIQQYIFLLFHLEELLKLYVNLFYRFCVTLLFLEIFEQKKSQIS